MVRFLIDEDLPTSTAAVFKRHGYPVRSVRSIGIRGATDEEIMDRAFDNDELIVTRDTDFGDVLRYPRDTHPGAVIVRLPSDSTADEINDRIDTFLTTVDVSDIRHSIIILELGRYRRRDL